MAKVYAMFWRVSLMKLFFPILRKLLLNNCLLHTRLFFAYWRISYRILRIWSNVQSKRVLITIFTITKFVIPIPVHALRLCFQTRCAWRLIHGRLYVDKRDPWLHQFWNCFPFSPSLWCLKYLLRSSNFKSEMRSVSTSSFQL
jgi:hypothetical protein